MEPQREPDYRFYETHYANSKTRYLLFANKHDLSPVFCWGEVDRFIHEQSESHAEAIDALPKTALEPMHFFPVYDPDWLRYTFDPSLPTVFVKKQRILPGEVILKDSKPFRFERRTTQELRVCEVLRQKPHPNLVKYLGCVTTAFLGIHYVTGIAYERYDTDLSQYARGGLLKREEVEVILANVRSGMWHLHDLKIVHADLRPVNIFLRLKVLRHVKKVQEAVIGDFDAALMAGEKIEQKCAPVGWLPNGVGFGDVAEPVFDEHSFRVLVDWMKNQLD